MLTRNGVCSAWVPATEADRSRVQSELEAILVSHHFRSSKRYPAMLRYVVEKTLHGQAHGLKERTLGVEVFERRPDYDTNADPVVRFTASEVRKRLAQYYHECDEEPDLQIELPLGSYVPEFNLWTEETEPPLHAQPQLHAQTQFYTQPQHILPDSQIAIQHLPETESSTPSPVTSVYPPRRSLWAMLAFSAIVVGVGLWIVHAYSTSDPTKAFWEGFFHSHGPVILVVGSGSLELTTPEPPQTNLYDHMVGPYHHISVSAAIAISRLTGVLKVHQVSNVVREAPTTTLADLREQSVILVGALNNEWTLRLIDPLRFRFVHGPHARIEDQQNPNNLDWAVNFNKPFSSITTDYAIVARYHDTTTNGNVMIVAGLGPYGTESASELAGSPQYLKQISRQLPSDWMNRNVELVLRTDVLDGQAGPPILVASTTW